jgi:hypothetical protein
VFEKPASQVVGLADVSAAGRVIEKDIDEIAQSSPGRTRTYDKAVNSRLLYQLSYRGMAAATGGES